MNNDHIIEAMLIQMKDPNVARYSNNVGILYTLKDETIEGLPAQIVVIPVSIDECNQYGFNPYSKEGLGQRWPEGIDRGRYVVMQYSSSLQAAMRNCGFDPKIAHGYSCNLVPFVEAQ